jgi:hypothetical protein
MTTLVAHLDDIQHRLDALARQHHVPGAVLAERGAAAKITLRHLLTHTSGIQGDHHHGDARSVTEAVTIEPRSRISPDLGGQRNVKSRRWHHLRGDSPASPDLDAQSAGHRRAGHRVHRPEDPRRAGYRCPDRSRRPQATTVPFQLRPGRGLRCPVHTAAGGRGVDADPLRDLRVNRTH